MTVDLPAPRGVDTLRGPRARIRPAPAGASGHVVIEGPGGTGKSVLLARIADDLRASGTTVVDGTAGAAPAIATGPCAVVVDDAQWLSEAALERIVRLVDEGDVPVALALRPWPRSAALTGVVHALGGERRVLGHLDRGTVQRWAQDRCGAALPPDLLEAVVTATGGLPALVEPVLRSLAHRDPHALPDGRLPVDDDVLDVVRTALGALDAGARGVVLALAAGAPLETEVLAAALAVPPHQVGELLEEARSSGVVLGSGAVVPLAVRVLRESS